MAYTQLDQLKTITTPTGRETELTYDPVGQVTKPQETQHSRLDWARITGHSGQSRLREAANIGRNWTKALEETIRHVCETASYSRNGSDSKINNNKLNEVILTSLLASASGISMLGLLGDLYKKKKSMNIFGATQVEVSKSLPQYSTGTIPFLDTAYIQHSVSVSSKEDGLIQARMQNGSLTGFQINGIVSNSIDFIGGLGINPSLNIGDYSLGIKGDLNMEGLAISVEFSNSKNIYETGLRANLDMINGTQGAFFKVSSENTSKTGETTTNSTEYGYRSINGNHIILVSAMALAPASLPLILSLAYSH